MVKDFFMKKVCFSIPKPLLAIPLKKKKGANYKDNHYYIYVKSGRLFLNAVYVRKVTNVKPFYHISECNCKLYRVGFKLQLPGKIIDLYRLNIYNRSMKPIFDRKRRS